MAKPKKGVVPAAFLANEQRMKAGEPLVKGKAGAKATPAKKRKRPAKKSKK
jgi:hypothetical protein